MLFVVCSGALSELLTHFMGLRLSDMLSSLDYGNEGQVTLACKTIICGSKKYIL